MTNQPEETVVFEYQSPKTSSLENKSITDEPLIDKTVKKTAETKSVLKSEPKIEESSVAKKNSSTKSKKNISKPLKKIDKLADTSDKVLVEEDMITVEPTEWPHIISFLLVVLPLILILIGYLILYLFFDFGILDFPILLIFGIVGLGVIFLFFWFNLKNNKESYLINRKRKVLAIIQKSFSGVSRTYYKITSYNSASVKQSSLGKRFDFGDIKLTNEKFKSSIKMYDVPEPFKVVEYMRQLLFT